MIDPKAISKDVLYGTMDPNTREWTDGLFTHILRKIIDNVRGEFGSFSRDLKKFSDYVSRYLLIKFKLK